jgi:hypothetical protein
LVHFSEGLGVGIGELTTNRLASDMAADANRRSLMGRRFFPFIYGGPFEMVNFCLIRLRTAGFHRIRPSGLAMAGLRLG